MYSSCRNGPHWATEQKKFEKRTPSDANLSILGVLVYKPPSVHPKLDQLTSSARTITKFGFSEAREAFTNDRAKRINLMDRYKNSLIKDQGLGVFRGLVHELLAIIVGEVITALFSVFVGDA